MNHAIIMARGGSKGIKKKNLKKIAGKPLIYWTLKYCLRQKFLKKVWVCSDNEEILDYVRNFKKIKTVKRPAKYSKDDSAIEPGLLFCINEIEKKEEIKNIFFLQATSPVRHKNSLKNAYKLFTKNKLDSLFSGNDNHNIFFRWTMKKNAVVPNYNYKSRPRRQKIQIPIVENGSFYIFNCQKFKRYKNRLFDKIGYFKQSLLESFQVDDKNDFHLVNLILKNQKLK